MKVYDTFLFFNEIDLLDIRINLLNDVVDFFVIVESTVTFSGKKKKLFFDENKEIFDRFKDKIIHIIVDDTPIDFLQINNLKYDSPKSKKEIFRNKILEYLDTSNGWNRDTECQWGREIYQRESIINGLINCNDEDVIIISDLDEIPNPEEIVKIKNEIKEDIYEFKQNMFYYNLNTLKERGWSGPKVACWKSISNIALNIIRQNKITTKVIQNGGWHLSFMGGESRIKDKIEAYAHQEYNNDYIKNSVTSNISSNMDIFFRGNLTDINITEEFPEKMIDFIRNKYKYMIK